MITLSQILEVFDTIYDKDKLDVFLQSLTDEEREKLYDHPLLREFDLLP